MEPDDQACIRIEAGRAPRAHDRLIGATFALAVLACSVAIAALLVLVIHLAG